MQEIREAEAKEQRESGGERSSGTGGPFSVGGGAGVGGASVGLEWSDEAREEVEELVKGEGGEGGVVQLVSCVVGRRWRDDVLMFVSSRARLAVDREGEGHLA